eukprot:UN27888
MLSTDTNDTIPSVRSYFNEVKFRKYHEAKIFSHLFENKDLTEEHYYDLDTKRLFRSARNYKSERLLAKVANDELSIIIQQLKDSSHLDKEPFEFYSKHDSTIPVNRIPSSGIDYIYRKFHYGRVIIPSSLTPETGFPPHPLILHIIVERYPQY